MYPLKSADRTQTAQLKLNAVICVGNDGDRSGDTPKIAETRCFRLGSSVCQLAGLGKVDKNLINK